MTTAELGIVCTAIVGGLGIVVPSVTRWLDRGHERGLGQASRLYEQRLSLYGDVATFLEVIRLMASRIQPMLVIGEPLAPPEGPSEEEQLALNGRLAVGGSEAVLAEVRLVGQAFRKFQGAVMVYEATPRGEPSWIEARRQMDEARDEVYTHADEAERLMRKELAEL